MQYKRVNAIRSCFFVILFGLGICQASEKRSQTAPLSEKTVQGTYKTRTESEWGAEVRLLPNHQAQIDMIEYSETGKHKDTLKGTWAPEGDLIVMKFEKTKISYSAPNV